MGPPNWHVKPVTIRQLKLHLPQHNDNHFFWLHLKVQKRNIHTRLLHTLSNPNQSYMVTF